MINITSSHVKNVIYNANYVNINDSRCDYIFNPRFWNQFIKSYMTKTPYKSGSIIDNHLKGIFENSINYAYKYITLKLGFRFFKLADAIPEIKEYDINPRNPIYYHYIISEDSYMDNVNYSISAFSFVTGENKYRYKYSSYSYIFNTTPFNFSYNLLYDERMSNDCKSYVFTMEKMTDKNKYLKEIEEKFDEHIKASLRSLIMEVLI